MDTKNKPTLPKGKIYCPNCGSIAKKRTSVSCECPICGYVKLPFQK